MLMLEFLWIVLKHWKAIAVASLIAAVPVAFLIGQARGDSAGYQRRIAEVAAADIKTELERKGDDAKLQTLSDYDLCVAGLRGSGLPVDACEQLRGVPEIEP
ncbi:hypothetical protein [Mesorhizobium sp. A623]